MRFLLLGYRHSISMLLSALSGSAFLANNKIDIILAATPSYANNVIQNTINNIKLTLDRSQLADFERDVTKAQKISSQIFATPDLDFMVAYSNIQFLPHTDLTNQLNLKVYDYMIVSSYAKKISPSIFEQPKMGTLNIHYSLLPDLRGGFPTFIQAFDSEQKRGITIISMSEGLDDGNIVIQKALNMDKSLTNEALCVESAQLAADCLKELQQENFRYKTIPQNSSRATYCNEVINTQKIIRRLHDLKEIPSAHAFEGYVRANHNQYLFPHVFAFYKDRLLIILAVQRLSFEKLPIEVPPSKKLFKLLDRYYVKFDEAVYLITQAIFKGKLLQSECHQSF